MRVTLVDQVDLPRSVPVLELLLAHDGTLHVAEQFVQHKSVNFVPAGMAGQRIVPVLPKTRDQIAGDTNVERAVVPTRQNVDERIALRSEEHTSELQSLMSKSYT